MWEFKGIDLSTKYVKPSTWKWLVEHIDDIEAPFTAQLYDGAQGILLWTYSFDADDRTVPADLRKILVEAFDRDWRFIVLDCDGADCELFDSYEQEWD